MRTQVMGEPEPRSGGAVSADGCSFSRMPHMGGGGGGRSVFDLRDALQSLHFPINGGADQSVFMFWLVHPNLITVFIPNSAKKKKMADKILPQRVSPRL